MTDYRIPLDGEFSPRRAWHFFVYQAAFQGPRWAVTAAVLAAIYAFFYLSTLWSGGAETLEVLWAGLFLVTAWVMAAGAFADTRRAARAAWWFLVPASPLEKYLVSTLVPVVLLVVGMPLLGVVTDTVSRGLALLLWDRDHSPFNPLARGYWWTVATALALVPSFFYGSVAFRRRALLKTLLVLVVSSVAVAAALTGLIWLVAGPGGVKIDEGEVTWGDVGLTLNLSPEILAWVAGTIFFAILPLFFLAAGFFRMAEREADDGIS